MKNFLVSILLSLSLSALADCRIKVVTDAEDPQLDYINRLVKDAGYRPHEISPNILYFKGTTEYQDVSTKRMKYTAKVSFDRHGSRLPETVYKATVTEVGTRDGVVPWVKSIQRALAKLEKCL